MPTNSRMATRRAPPSGTNRPRILGAQYTTPPKAAMTPASTTYEATEVVTDVPKRESPPPPSTWVSIGSIACSAPMARPTSSMSTEAAA